jgi:uncharacterized protein (DUF2147 family)
MSMLLPLLLLAISSSQPLDVEGTWWTKGRLSQVTIERENDTMVGRITWYEGIEEEQVFDTANPDEELQTRELLGLPIITGFEEGEKQWRKGRIYDPTEGKTYRSAIFRMDEDTLGVKGCVAMICLTQEWERVAPEEKVTIDRAPLTKEAMNSR